MEFDLNKRHCFYFNELCKIPHGSGNEKGVSDYLVEFAKEKGLRYVRDELYNVIIYKDASKGHEDSEPLIIQAHVDMVPEKNKDSAHDFLKDPLDLYVEDGFLKAKGTTLGADDGTGVAYMLAILEDDSLIHPALECTFTTQEEIGLIGSMVLKSEYFKGHRMISLDGGGEISTSISSAGGCVFKAYKKLHKEPFKGNGYVLMIRGLSGGHSGGEIHKEKGNANVLAARMIQELKDDSLRLVSIDGGLKDNAIPRECDLTFTSELERAELVARLDKSQKAIKEELEFSDGGFFYELQEVKSEEALTKKDSEDILDFIYLMPNGFMHRSMAIEGLTITSLNLGVIKTDTEAMVLDISIRSALESGIDNLIGILTKLADILGFSYETSARYPGWNYSEVSPMRDKFRKVLKDLYAIDLVETASHGGCECGVFKALIPGIDIISLGPVAYDVHTPDERLDLASFDRSFEILKGVVKECA